MNCIYCSEILINDKINEESICRLCGCLLGKNAKIYHCTKCSSLKYSLCNFCKICPEGHYLGKLTKSRFNNKICFNCNNETIIWRVCISCEYEICQKCID